jgi:hypothetical protein
VAARRTRLAASRGRPSRRSAGRGAEIIGYDPDRGTYVTQYFGSDGPAAYEPGFGAVDGAVIWTMRSRANRFTGTFSDDGDSITGHWELLEGSSWRPWMDITLTKQES